MSERFVVVEGSESEHCCFEASVVDTMRPLMWGGVPCKDFDDNQMYYCVCECLEVEDAYLVCKALNLSHEQSLE